MSRVHHTPRKVEHFRKFIESAMIQKTLMDREVEIIYLDEFTVNDRNHNHYGWSKRGTKAYLDLSNDSFCMSFGVAFSANIFYGIGGTTRTSNSTFIAKFIGDLLDTRHRLLDEWDENYVIIGDNARIHSSVMISKFLKNGQIRMLTICPYEPSLNPTELIINYIKTRVKRLRETGR